ncbi:Reverse transcriptase domain-containing protein [Strongyloides ratti]|uniref:Reverse transcriptase domain-containing protein n=1 Tax=Strongyloides ratti TaxID=34506 RepID=A0A090L2C5_STRRB|nr:Reverse transcriptase domain-containing protein [Strongyloides ratti]CEF61619.1 Reverse transcriptase domain-containing protein [Strongyloides ratti]
MQKFSVPKDSSQIFLVDSILNKHICSTKNKVKDVIKRRSIIKTLICAAGLTLRKLVCGKLGNNKYNSKINQLWKKERKIINCIEDLKHLIETNKRRHNFGKRLRNAKVSPSEMLKDYYNKLRYIKNEITACLDEHKKAILRTKFKLTPSIKIISNIQNHNDEEAELPKEEEFVKYYKELFTNKDGDDKETPHLDNWLKKFSKTLIVDWTINDKEILEALKYCGNFKAPGSDMVMKVCYKWFKSAQNYLIRWIKSTWYGEYTINKKDTNAVTFMIWKRDGKPKNDVKSYRPISCLNCDFKLLNKLIANKIYESIEKILPINQMAVIKNKHGTCEALLLYKSLVQSMKFRRTKDVKEIWCSWIDFSKCYDSISHKCLKKMIQSIKAPPIIHKLILDGIDSWNISICNGKNISKTKIPVKSGILQGKVASSLYFVLLTGEISYALNKEEQVPIETITPSNTLKINHISFIDDYQLYATSQKKVEKLTIKLREIAEEMNLKLNPQKCGIYGTDDLGKRLMLKESSLNFPYTSEYKYLGLVENSLDLKDINIQLFKDKILSKYSTIFESRLTTHQKRKVFNSTISPCAAYYLGNLITNKCSIQELLNECKKFDQMVRNQLVNQNIKKLQVSNSRIYLPKEYNSLGLNEIEIEVAANIIRKACYIKKRETLRGVDKLYIAMSKNGHRNTLSDALYITKKYSNFQINWNIMGMVKDQNNILLDAKKIIENIKEKRRNLWLEHWKKGNMTYANEAIKKEFHLPDLNIDSKYLMLCYAGSEEQIIYNGHVSLVNQSSPSSRLCRKCNKLEETSYHVASVCEFHKKNLHLMRHNSAVYHIITELCRIMKVKCTLRYPEASGIIKSGNMKIAAGVKYTFGTAKIYHNKPDLVWYTPEVIYVIEVSISSLKNAKSQMKMKTARYAVNSTKKLENFAALNNLKKGENFVEILSHKANFKRVHFMPLVFCTFGEIPKETMKYLEKLNFSNEKIKTIASPIARYTGRTLKAHFTN